jgi:hydrogenase nickel incorporation protein HypB
MCIDCGCSAGESKIVGHSHSHDDGHTHDHHHENRLSPAHAHAPNINPARMVKIEQDILGKNNQYAQGNRDYFRQHGIFTLNLVSSPGSGKTTLLTKTIELLKAELTISVIEGDQQTSNDSERIRATGVKAVQINTGKGCHLDAHGIGHALETLAPEDNSVLFVENVGNLVCPSAFDLGEAHKVVILSVTEGEDKPLKYPDMFAAADVMLLNKIDLLPHVDFDVAQCIDYARRVNPRIKVLQVSARTGEGMELWLQWLKASYAVAAIG